MKQLIAHMVGDYILQSDWMARKKGSSSLAAASHAIAYTIPFIALKPRVGALAGIAATHYVIDRYRLARYVVWAKNFLEPEGLKELDALIVGEMTLTGPSNTNHPLTATGMPPGTPDGLATGLMIVADNTLHLMLNAFFLKED